MSEDVQFREAVLVKSLVKFRGLGENQIKVRHVFMSGDSCRGKGENVTVNIYRSAPCVSSVNLRKPSCYGEEGALQRSGVIK